MQHGALSDPSTYQALIDNILWQEVFDWLTAKTAQLPDGEHAIRGRDVYANIHTAVTIPREQGVFEAHQQYIDLHYCLTGSEIIEWVPVETLTIKQPYDAAKDYALYESPAQAPSIPLSPGTFAIFMPGEAHMPKLTDDKNKQVRKIVIKIRYSLLQQA